MNVSLARTCEWMTSMGLIKPDPVDAARQELAADFLANCLIDVPTPYGRLTRLRPVIRYSEEVLNELPVWRSFGDGVTTWVD